MIIKMKIIEEARNTTSETNKEIKRKWGGHPYMCGIIFLVARYSRKIYVTSDVNLQVGGGLQYKWVY